MRRVLHYLWEVWLFVLTFVVMPAGTIAWWLDPSPRPWGYLMALLVTVTGVFMIFSWFERHGRER